MKGRTTVAGQGSDTEAITANRNNKEVVFKYCDLFISCVSEINNTSK